MLQIPELKTRQAEFLQVIRRESGVASRSASFELIFSDLELLEEPIQVVKGLNQARAGFYAAVFVRPSASTSSRLRVNDDLKV